MKSSRTILDIMMTILSIILMGGTILFPDERIHQILGLVMLGLWICHVVLNRRWFGSIFRGTYTPYRTLQTVVNIGILLCALLLMISGIMMSWFLPFDVDTGLGFARIAHLLSSHWYYIFMCAHIGLHVATIVRRILHDKPFPVIAKIIITFICAYGVYALFVRKIFSYLFLQQQFFFFDFERGSVLFALDYLSILILIASLFHLLGNFLLKRKLKNKA